MLAAAVPGATSPAGSPQGPLPPLSGVGDGGGGAVAVGGGGGVEVGGGAAVGVEVGGGVEVGVGVGGSLTVTITFMASPCIWLRSSPKNHSSRPRK